MFYRSHVSAPPLDDFVEYFWALEDAPAHPHERILPTGTLELVINLHEDEFRVYDPVDLHNTGALNSRPGSNSSNTI